MQSVLFVCLGNICRSPLAEAIFNHQISKKQLEGRFRASSCGTANYHIGDPPDTRTLQNALKNGIVIHHLGRQFDHRDWEEFDLIVPMDQSNKAHLMRMPEAIKFKRKIKLMRDFDPEGVGADVPDPYYGSKDDFQKVFDILDRSIREFIQFLETNPSIVNQQS